MTPPPLNLENMLMFKEDIQSCSNTQATYPPYDFQIHVFFLTLYVMYIPLILVSSSMIFCAVNFITDLHNPHNYIIRSIAVMDLLTALVDIPIILLIESPQTRCTIIDGQFCIISQFLYNFLDHNYLSFLTFLCVDRFLMINFSTLYRNRLRHSYRGYVVLPSLFIVLYHGVDVGIVLFIGYESSRCHKASSVSIQVDLSELAVQLVVCLCLCVQVFSVSLKHARDKDIIERRRLRVTMALLMLFILLYAPTLAEQVLALLDKRGQYVQHRKDLPLFHNVTRIVRFLIPVSNMLVIALTKPLYKKAFVYFFTHRPTRWRLVQGDIWRRSCVNELRPGPMQQLELTARLVQHTILPQSVCSVDFSSIHVASMSGLAVSVKEDLSPSNSSNKSNKSQDSGCSTKSKDISINQRTDPSTTTMF